jgi:hypothetical protein
LDVPLGTVVELIARGVPAATRERATVAVAVWAGEAASWTDTPKEKFPLAVGVPEIRPVDVFRLSPAGRLPETKDQMYGAVPPLAWSEFE